MQRRHESASINRDRLRRDIVEEEQLRRGIARHEALRRSSPELWRAFEQTRAAQNDAIAATNRRLVTLGLKAIALEPSLAQRRRRLKRLEASNMAALMDS